MIFLRFSLIFQTSDTQDKVVKTAESETESKKMTEIIEYENKYNHVYSWITNIGESFLTQHRDMGVDVTYVSDYLDNHQQMAADLKVTWVFQLFNESWINHF